MNLYMHPFSTYSRRVRIALIEKNLTADEVVVDMVARKHREPDYLALNPYGRVPTLVDGDFVLYESTPILSYLEATHPEPALVPGDVKQRALVDMQVKLCDLQFTRQAATIIFPKRFMPKDRWDEGAMAKARGELDNQLAILEHTLSKHDFLVADQFTLADLVYIPFVEFFPLLETTAPPGVARWCTRLLDRPSARQTKPSM